MPKKPLDYDGFENLADKLSVAIGTYDGSDVITSLVANPKEMSTG